MSKEPLLHSFSITSELCSHFKGGLSCAKLGVSGNLDKSPFSSRSPPLPMGGVWARETRPCRYFDRRSFKYIVYG